MSEFDTGYSAVIGKPVVHAEKKATGSSVSFPCEAIPDGSYLVSLEVNGTVKAYRESLEFSSGSCTVGAYTLSYSSYALTVSGTSNNNIVRVMVEPLEVKTTDAFRAAVKKDAPETPNELPAVSAADDGKVLTANSGVWGAEFLGGSGRKLQIEATYSDGAYVTNTQITPDEYYRAVTSGYTCELFIGAGTYKLHLLMEVYNSFALYKATLQDTSNVIVTINGFDQEYLSIYIEPYDNRFIVTLTPTAQDYSGTMDKTVAEINAAYEAGQEIWFSIAIGDGSHLVPVNHVTTGNSTYPKFDASMLVATVNLLVNITTNFAGGDSTIYYTTIYTLTPAT